MEAKNMKTALIDGYLDEPSCLGVPPYISPHIRYTYGALLAAGIKKENLKYITIDDFREKKKKYLELLKSYDLIIIIAGTTVPGHYLGGRPVSITELNEIAKELYYPAKVLGGPITLVKKEMAAYDHICKETAPVDIYELLTDKKVSDSIENITDNLDKWAKMGAVVTKEHPNYPEIVCEIETFRGCPRQNHCAFCSERLKKLKYHRKTAGIIEEIKELARLGNHYYRLGCQTDLMLFRSHRDSRGRLIPAADEIKKLYIGIREADPELKVLHMDNLNPAALVNNLPESRKILETIVKYNTAGDIAAFGLESADPLVLKKNNIETDADITFRAIEIMNEIGGIRSEGIPRLLPGINLLHGLIGERAETMEYNYNFLEKVFTAGLMLRRINIRKVVTLDSYPDIPVDQNSFEEYKEKINENINRPMLQRVFPAGTIMKNILIEKKKGKVSYGRQPGTYPILIGIPGDFKINCFIDARVIDHGYRSITALPWPFKIKKASVDQLTYIPGVGRKRANEIFIQEPKDHKELRKILGNDFPYNEWRDWFIF